MKSENPGRWRSKQWTQDARRRLAKAAGLVKWSAVHRLLDRIERAELEVLHHDLSSKDRTYHNGRAAMIADVRACLRIAQVAQEDKP